MSEENKNIALELPPTAPDLDLTEAVDEMTSVNLELTGAKAEEEKPPVQAPSSQDYLKDANLTESEQKMVEQFSEKIDLRDSNIVLQYGAAAQKKVSEFADTALTGVKTKDLGEVGDMIT